MNIIDALRQEEQKLKDQLAALQKAIELLGGQETGGINTSVKGKKRHISAAGRAKIAAATKARWAKFRARKAKAGKVAVLKAKKAA